MNNFQPIQAQQIQIPESVKTGFDNVGNTFNNVKSSITESINQFSDSATAGVGASSSFLSSNTVIAKIAFLILVLIVFMFLVNLGIILIGYFLTPSDDPYIIKGMIDGTNSKVVSQDPKSKDTIPIKRSNNQTSGIELTWSFWIYLNDLGNENNKYQHIFNKGDSNFDNTSAISTINNSPGVYLGPKNNSLLIIMDTVNSTDTNNRINIENIPIRKWVHVAIRIKNTILDVYVNGVVSNRLVLMNVPKQNFNDINLCQNGGFNGKLSNLRYYSRALNVFEINAVVLYGPNLNIADTSSLQNKNFNYLSRQWYSQQL
uniref:LamG-like jellyroll fold domain-containing protein n=1 Tax=viral metagenome TaxID=1070528 RepID=A0A6C0E841_9ZZZZ